jgi:hypothetical protein
MFVTAIHFHPSQIFAGNENTLAYYNMAIGNNYSYKKFSTQATGPNYIKLFLL